MQIPTPTTRFSARRSSIFAAIALASLFAIPQTASATPLWPDPPNSPISQIVLDLFLIVFVIGLIAIIGYTLAILGAGRAEVDDDAPEADDSSSKGAVTAGVVLFVVFAILGSFALSKSNTAEESVAGTSPIFKPVSLNEPGLKVAHVIKPPKSPAVSIRVNAQQFLWRYEYTGIKSKWKTYSYNTLVIPSGVTVLLDFTSSDAEAAWWVPQLGGSITAMPGYANKTWIRADKAGLYTGAGTVVNGTNYANQTTNVLVMPVRNYARWLLTKQAQINEAMTLLGIDRASGREAELITGQKSSTLNEAVESQTGDGKTEEDSK